MARFLVAGQGHRGGFFEKLLKLPLCLTEPIPAGSTTDALPAKAESISDSGSASVITHLRRKKKLRGTQKRQLERELRMRKRNNPADTKVSEEGGGGGAPRAGADIPLQPMVKTMVKQAIPLQPVEDPTPEHVGA